ncbi:maltokinase [Streptomyces sp. ITFR-21]|nr:maltokinase [Streptomyces sp. ITFR-21]WNI18184.1 maltokinase [Streptomyces sp. ITFR-21]
MPGLLRSLDPLLRGWLPRQRWFAGKGLPIGRLGLAAATELVPPGGRLGPLGLLHVLIDVEQPGRAADCYQLLLGAHPLLPSSLVHAGLGPAVGGPYDGMTLYDAPHDPRLAAVLLERLRVPGQAGRLRFTAEPSADIPPGLIPRVSTAEQSNTSVVFGDAYILKLFRRVSPGTNPDLELSLALARAGSRRVAEPVAWFEALAGSDGPATTADGDAPGNSGGPEDSGTREAEVTPGNDRAPAGRDAEHGEHAERGEHAEETVGEPVTLGVLQRFLPGSSDGWTLATASVAEDGDFRSEAAALGRATAEVHASLAAALPVVRLDGAALERIASAMARRLEETAAEVPAIRPYADALRAAFDDLSKAGAGGEAGSGVLAQRVHGDLHLGQALRGPDGAWVLIDFEGEPARPLAERRRPAPPVQDVAGMLRSFDYAAHHSGNGPWAARHRDAFCAGYAEVSGTDPREQPVLIRAFETDKAVYEARYEARHRPAWLPIPLSALARLATSAV